ncbi:DUF1045 domain-containing protein [Rhodovulum sp. 12E13]|uniref:DUF1045 domain-containing protein n=1 Tax=Rhodovulum sp. 12E13 TaxID=2203891 RepID=UPI000E193E78|nr:DUF1045 domain-containing protein [Rhodovulum sp. 12E13]RDC71072.1 DUF1045 domain-containing protein [Rhodovulum sp. 12E13]
MDGYTRFALYYAPPPGALATLGAQWLGWDAEAGRGASLPPGQDWPTLPRPQKALTRQPRAYGFHGTLKPPFALAEDRTVTGLHAAVSALAPRLHRLRLDGLRVAEMGDFLALVPEGDTTALDALAATLVEALDGFRAAPTDAEVARRRAAGLTERQETMLARWGYPFVMDEFRFHITLTGPIPDAAERAAVADALRPLFEPLIERPFRIDEICLFGEGQDGRFRNLHRYPLSG